MNIDQRKIHTSEATDGGFIRILQAASTWFLLGNIPTEQLKLTVEVPTQSGGRGNLVSTLVVFSSQMESVARRVILNSGVMWLSLLSVFFFSSPQIAVQSTMRSERELYTTLHTFVLTSSTCPTFSPPYC